uniref:WAT1-related protein n=1 Tax=Cucumis sativus TaxID=3659 RepID=A0A0A0LBM2_CUCSA
MGLFFGHFFQNAMPYIAVIFLQFGYAGLNILSAIALNGGISHYVLVVYRHVFATAIMVPFALILERKFRPKITVKIFIQMFVLALLGPLLDQNLYYMGLKLTSPTIACAIGNMLPSMTFAMAVICKIEKLDLKRVRCRAKLLGTIVTLGGAMLMTFYKGSVVNFLGTKHGPQPNIPSTAVLKHHNKGEYIKGSILLIISNLAWAAFFVLQAITLRKYTAHLSLTALVCFLGTLQAIVATLAMERRLSVWTIGWDWNLLASAYAGIVTTGVAYYVQGLVMKRRGPVFVTAFGPMVVVIVAFMGHFILAEEIYVGGIIGTVVIVIGLYFVLWGMYKESKEKKEEVNGEIIVEAIIGEGIELAIDQKKEGLTITTIPSMASPNYMEKEH